MTNLLNRRTFVQTGLAATGAAMTSSLPLKAATPARTRPNLLFIYTEGQRADCMGVAGHPILRTPNQDRSPAKECASQMRSAPTRCARRHARQ